MSIQKLRRSAIALVSVLAGLSTARSSFAKPSDAEVDRSARGLLEDVERIVDIQETLGWYLDDEAYESIRDAMMRSVCEATPEVRERALGMLLDVTMKAGSPVDLFEANEREMTGEVAEALEVQRRYEVLTKAAREAEDGCPFWDTPDIAFEGRQTDRNRFTLSLETGGVLQLRRMDGGWTYGGGGAGRLLPGYGFGGRFTILAGVEFGGGGLIVPDSDPTEFAINYLPALPVVFRVHDSNLHYDVELAPVALFQASDMDVSYGGRIGIGGGFSALRTQGLLPWAGMALAYEHYLESGGRPRTHFLRGGFRVGFVWDP